MTMKQNDIIIVKIIDYGMDGEGIAKQGDFTVFVKFACVGETVKAKIAHVKKNLVFANLLEIIEKSNARAEYQCNRFMRCGGCDLLHLDYGEQLKLKKKNLENLLEKNTNVKMEIDSIVPSPKILGYRNKIQLPFGMVNNKVAVGFYKPGTHKIVSITKCFLHGEWIEKLIRVFLEFANWKNLTVYDDITQKGLLRHLIARYINGKICIVVVINAEELPFEKDLITILDKEFSDTYSLYVSPKLEHNNVVMGKTAFPIIERNFTIEVLGVKFTVNPFSFMQLNNEVRDLIYTRVISEISKTPNNIIIDAYAGVGLMGAVLAKNGARVYNIEILKEAIEDAKKLAEINNLSDRITNICGDASQELPLLINQLLSTLQKNFGNPNNNKSGTQIFQTMNFIPDKLKLNYSQKLSAESNEFNKSNNISIDCINDSVTNYDDEIKYCEANGDGTEQLKTLNIILDPPRKGCSIKVINALNSITAPHTLFYISCNPATLTRDLALLKSYTIKSIIPYDMFPQTKHIETLVCLTRK